MNINFWNFVYEFSSIANFNEILFCKQNTKPSRFSSRFYYSETDASFSRLLSILSFKVAL